MRDTPLALHEVTVHVGGRAAEAVAPRAVDEAATRLSWGVRSVAAWRIGAGRQPALER
jgi:hypothetical protein